MTDVRLRFSPAPSGHLQLGNVRTALYNFLYARHTAGTYILRIEDTDVARSTQESIDGIQQTLRWLGLVWDEGPFLQSHRFDAYLAAAQQLLDNGNAYECFCTEDEVKARNEEAMRAGRPPGYDGRCRTLTADERAERHAQGRPVSTRFRTPDDGHSTFTDLIRGEVSVEWSTISDFVIVRSNGTPVFFLANALDDIDMQITHVLRGEDLIDSTHRVLALRHALGHSDAPVYAHLPLIMGHDGGKLSKRHGASSVEEYRDAGYLASALLNYLALLGWGPADGREVLTIDELVAEFDLADVNQSSARFDPRKLDWMNGEHIRKMTRAELVAAVLPFARSRYGGQLDIPRYERAVELAQERAVTLVQIADQMAFLFTADDALTVDAASWEKLVKVEQAASILDAAIAYIERCEWTESIDVRPPIEALGLKAGKVMHVLYTAIEGTSAGLPLFPSIALLGRASALARLRAARARL